MDKKYDEWLCNKQNIITDVELLWYKKKVINLRVATVTTLRVKPHHSIIN